MASHGCYLCLLLFTVILIEPSEAGCMNYFTKAEWKSFTIHKLPENIPVKIMNKSEDIVVCSLMKEKDCKNKTEETCFLRKCFEDYKPTCNETEESISVPFYHFMCLTSIAKGLRDKTNGRSQKPTAEDVCKVYEKVCKRDSPNPAAKTTTPTACTTTTPTTEATTTPTTEATTTTTEATTNKTTAIPSATTTTTTTEAATTTTEAATTTTTEAKTTTTTEATTTTPTTEATTEKPEVSTTAVSTITPSSPLNLPQKDETLQGESAEKKERILLIIIGFLIFTHFLWLVAFYMYTQRLQRNYEIPNLKEEEAMTVHNTSRSDIEEGSILLTTPESSIIINSPETTIIQSPCPHRTHL